MDRSLQYGGKLPGKGVALDRGVQLNQVLEVLKVMSSHDGGRVMHIHFRMIGTVKKDTLKGCVEPKCCVVCLGTGSHKKSTIEQAVTIRVAVVNTGWSRCCPEVPPMGGGDIVLQVVPHGRGGGPHWDGAGRVDCSSSVI